MALHLPPPVTPPHKPTRQHERPLYKLTRMSERRTLIFILNTILLHTIQEHININDVHLYLRLEVLAWRNVVVPPALRLHDEQVKQQHDGYIVDLGCVGREGGREVDGVRSQYVDFDATVVGVPAWDSEDGTSGPGKAHCAVWSASGSTGSLGSLWFL